MKSRGSVTAVVLVVLVAAICVALLFWVRRADSGGGPGDAPLFSNYAGFRLLHGKLPDAALEASLLATADRELRAHGLESRGEGEPAAADEFAVVIQNSTGAAGAGVLVRLVNSDERELWSGQLSATDAVQLRSFGEQNLAQLLRDPRFERPRTSK